MFDFYDFLALLFAILLGTCAGTCISALYVLLIIFIFRGLIWRVRKRGKHKSLFWERVSWHNSEIITLRRVYPTEQDEIPINTENPNQVVWE
jgi:hypothetical protein